MSKYLIKSELDTECEVLSTLYLQIMSNFAPDLKIIR